MEPPITRHEPVSSGYVNIEWNHYRVLSNVVEYGWVNCIPQCTDGSICGALVDFGYIGMVTPRPVGSRKAFLTEKGELALTTFRQEKGLDT